MTKINRITDNKCWQSCGERGALIHCCWEHSFTVVGSTHPLLLGAVIHCCWEHPSTVVGITHLLLLGALIHCCWDHSSTAVGALIHCCWEHPSTVVGNADWCSHSEMSMANSQKLKIKTNLLFVWPRHIISWSQRTQHPIPQVVAQPCLLLLYLQKPGSISKLNTLQLMDR